MTSKQCQAAIRNLGLSCVRTAEGEWRINYHRGTEATAYYTTEISDALDTARAMAKAMPALPVCATL